MYILSDFITNVPIVFNNMDGSLVDMPKQRAATRDVDVAFIAAPLAMSSGAGISVRIGADGCSIDLIPNQPALDGVSSNISASYTNADGSTVIIGPLLVTVTSNLAVVGPSGHFNTLAVTTRPLDEHMTETESEKQARLATAAEAASLDNLKKAKAAFTAAQADHEATLKAAETANAKHAAEAVKAAHLADAKMGAAKVATEKAAAKIEADALAAEKAAAGVIDPPAAPVAPADMKAAHDKEAKDIKAADVKAVAAAKDNDDDKAVVFAKEQMAEHAKEAKEIKETDAKAIADAKVADKAADAKKSDVADKAAADKAAPKPWSIFNKEPDAKPTPETMHVHLDLDGNLPVKK